MKATWTNTNPIAGFNPCFSGCASWIRLQVVHGLELRRVSILVLVDAPLECKNRSTKTTRGSVSILVLVDAPLEFVPSRAMAGDDWSFNPCFSGCASWILQAERGTGSHAVSILVLVDAPLEWYFGKTAAIYIYSFNPCFSGCASWIRSVQGDRRRRLKFQSLF